MNDKPPVVYVCLQATRQGQASYAHVHEIIKGLTAEGWPVTLVEPDAAKVSRRGGLARAVSFAGTQLRALSAIRRQRARVVYMRLHFALAPLVWAMRVTRTPFVVEVNGTEHDVFLAWPSMKRVSWLVRWGTRTQLVHATTVIAVTEGLADWVRATTGRTDTQVVPNAVDSELFTPSARSSSLAETPFAIFVGAFAPWQGIRTVLDAAMSTEWPEAVRLVLLGDGECAGEVEAAAARCDRIEWLGSRPYAEIPAYLASSVCALVPMGECEGRSAKGLSPLKLYEAMACGVPVVVTDHPGQADLVRENECGVVVPSDDSSSLARGVDELWRDPARRASMGEHGRRAVERSENWAARAHATGEILERVTSA